MYLNQNIIIIQQTCNNALVYAIKKLRVQASYDLPSFKYSFIEKVPEKKCLF